MSTIPVLGRPRQEIEYKASQNYEFCLKTEQNKDNVVRILSIFAFIIIDRNVCSLQSNSYFETDFQLNCYILLWLNKVIGAGI